MKNNVLALIVARSGRIRDGLQALLTGAHQIGSVRQASDGPSALKMIAEQHPALVILDTGLPGDEVQAVLRQIMAQDLRHRCLVLALADNTEQRKAASAAGADAVLFKGASATQLFATIEKLLSQGEVVGSRGKSEDLMGSR